MVQLQGVYIIFKVILKKTFTLFFTAAAKVCKNIFVFSGSWPATTFDGFKFTGWLVTIATWKRKRNDSTLNKKLTIINYIKIQCFFYEIIINFSYSFLLPSLALFLAFCTILISLFSYILCVRETANFYFS